MELTTPTLATVIIGSLAILAMLNGLSTTILREIAIHDLRLETHRLRIEYAKRIEQLRRGRTSSVEIIGEPMPLTPAEPSRRAA